MIFDNMRTAVKGGLYDPALGPMDPKERCVPARQSRRRCHPSLAAPLLLPRLAHHIRVLLKREPA